jgi:hypothetical protein
MRYQSLFVLALVAQACVADAKQPQDLSWLSGYWLSCADGQQVSETWSDKRGGVVVGVNFGVAEGRATWEFLRIGPSSADAASLSYFAAPSGQAPTEFPVAPAKSGEGKLVFENPAHDFPQRIVYERKDDRLDARIEGMLGGKLETMGWSFSPAKLNEGCRS